MKENKLKSIDGKKIRRQYFNIPIFFLYGLMITIPYTIFIFDICLNKFDPSDFAQDVWEIVWVCFVFSLPLLILKALNKRFFGRVICVLNEKGLHYPSGMLLWETIEKIEYAIDSKPRYKTDPAGMFRAIVYTTGGKHVVLPKAPLSMLSKAKKYKRDLDIKIVGTRYLLAIVLIAALIITVLPFYVMLLMSAPEGLTTQKLIALVAIFLVASIIRTFVFNAYTIEYRFWRRILPKKWLSYIILWCYWPSFFVVWPVLLYFPNWIVVSLVGIYLGIAQPPIPSKRSGQHNRDSLRSYEKLYDIYITHADLWEKNIAKNQRKKAAKKKRK